MNAKNVSIDDQARHDTYVRRLSQAGYKLTHARLTVLQAIEQRDGHVTSAEVLADVAELDESIGRASVFRTLDLFTRIGIVRPTYIDGLSPSYVLLPDGHHHHIICTGCGDIIEFDDCCLGDLQNELSERYGVTISGHMLEFFGLCQRCTQTRAEAEE